MCQDFEEEGPGDHIEGLGEALVTGSDWAWFPLSNPGIISIPAGFFFGWLGTVTSKEPESEKRYTELEVRSLTGAGSDIAQQADLTIRAIRIARVKANG